MSPELLDPDSFGLKKSRPTKESDCYALGMVIYEVLSGQTPFAPLVTPLVIRKVLQGERPGRPKGEGGKRFADGIWEVLERCWKHQPKERINAKAVLLCLGGAPPLLLSSSDTDLIAESDTDEQSDAISINSSMFSPFHRRSQAYYQSSSSYNSSADYASWRRTPDSTKRSSPWCGKSHDSTRWW